MQIFSYVLIVFFSILIWPPLMVIGFSLALEKIARNEGFTNDELLIVKQEKMGHPYIGFISMYSLAMGICVCIYTFTKLNIFLWILGTISFLMIIFMYKWLDVLMTNIRKRFRGPNII